MSNRFFLLILVLAYPTLLGYAGHPPLSLGSIAGKVYDKSTGEALPGANVIIVGSRLGGVTDEDGRFTIKKISPGTFQMKVSLIGYATMNKSAVSVQPGQQTSVDVALERADLEMNEVPVFANPFVKLPEASVSTTHLAGSEIKVLAGGLQDPMRAVSLLPGVARTKIDRNDLLVRGGGPSENLMVVDDIELPYFSHYGTQGASGGAVSFIDMELVDRVSFSSGGFGVVYGNKLSSVCTISLREGNSSRLCEKWTISATEIGMNVEGPVAGQSTFLFSARKSYLGAVFRAYGFSFVPEFWDYLGKVTIHLGSQDKITYLSVGSKDAFSLKNGTEEERYENSRLLFTDQAHNFGGLRWSHQFETGLFSLTYRVAQSEFNDWQQDVELNDIFASKSKEAESSLEASTIVVVPNLGEVSAGTEVRSMHFRSRIDFPKPTSMYGEPVGPVAAAFDTTAKRAALYLQVSRALGGAKVVLGTRASYFGISDRHWFLAPRFSASIPVSECLSFSGSVGQYYQAPSSIWLVATPFNRGLIPMGARHIIVGGEYVARNSYRISVEAYQKRYFDIPVSLSRPYLAMTNTGVGLGASLDGAASYGIDSLISAGRGQSRGIEVLLQKKAIESPWFGMLSVTYASSNFTPLDGRTRPTSYDQRWVINLALGYQVGGTWNVGGAWHYFSGRPYSPLGGDLEDRYNSERLPANHSLDVSVSRDWKIGEWTLRSFLSIQNAYNRKPYEAPIYSERRQRVEQPPSLGIVPSIGISLETK
jgi:outer membrane receptor protein involved in Fe transport